MFTGFNRLGYIIVPLTLNITAKWSIVIDIWYQFFFNLRPAIISKNSSILQSALKQSALKATESGSVKLIRQRIQELQWPSETPRPRLWAGCAQGPRWRRCGLETRTSGLVPLRESTQYLWWTSGVYRSVLCCYSAALGLIICRSRCDHPRWSYLHWSSRLVYLS